MATPPEADAEAEDAPREDEEEEDEQDEESEEAEWGPPRPLEACLTEAMVEPPLFWLREFRGPEDSVSPQQSWDSATFASRRRTAQWIRNWSEDDALSCLKDTMGSLDGTIRSVFREEATSWARRWAASVLLDVFGDKEDLANSIEVGRPFKFATLTSSLPEVSVLKDFEDLWSGDGSRAEDLLDFVERRATLALDEHLDDVHEILCRWVVATAVAELLHARLKAAPPSQEDCVAETVDDDDARRPQNTSARDALLQKAQSMRAQQDDDDDDDDDDDEWHEDDVPDVPLRRPVSAPEKKEQQPDMRVSRAGTTKPSSSASGSNEEAKTTEGSLSGNGRKPLPARPKSAFAGGSRPQTAVGAYYETNAVSKTRHDKGYDVLDKEMAKLDDASTRAVEARRLLAEHVAAMRRHGLARDVEFNEAKIGLAVALARYGKSGRRFVCVERSDDPDAARPGDELVAVNGAYVVDPTEASIAQLTRFIVDAPRPLAVTLLRGESPDDDRPLESSTEKKNTGSMMMILTTKDVTGQPTVECDFSDGSIRRVRVFQEGKRRKARLVGRFSKTDPKATDGDRKDNLIVEDAKGATLGSCVGPGPVVDLLDDKDRVVAYCDLGSQRILDTKRTTKFHLDRSGLVKDHAGLHCGNVDNFAFSQMRLLALVVTFVVPDETFPSSGERKKKSFSRTIRKTGSKLTGMSGFFS